MKITLSGSISFQDKMLKVRAELEKLGHKVESPSLAIENKLDTEKKREHMRTHFSKINWADCILVMNYDKNGIKNYIGINTLMEMAVAFEKNKKIFLYNPIPEISAKEEIAAMNPIVINENLSLLNKKPGTGFGVILSRQGKILLGKRNDDPEKASSELHGEGTWTLPGGKLDFMESFEDGAKREVFEETGIKINSCEVTSVYNNITHDAHFVTIGLISMDFEGEARTMEPEEITEWKWFDINCLPEPLYFPSEKMIENFRLKKFYIKR